MPSVARTYLAHRHRWFLRTAEKQAARIAVLCGLPLLAATGNDLAWLGRAARALLGATDDAPGSMALLCATALLVVAVARVLRDGILGGPVRESQSALPLTRFERALPDAALSTLAVSPALLLLGALVIVPKGAGTALGVIGLLPATIALALAAGLAARGRYLALALAIATLAAMRATGEPAARFAWVASAVFAGALAAWETGRAFERRILEALRAHIVARVRLTSRLPPAFALAVAYAWRKARPALTARLFATAGLALVAVQVGRYAPAATQRAVAAALGAAWTAALWSRFAARLGDVEAAAAYYANALPWRRAERERRVRRTGMLACLFFASPFAAAALVWPAPSAPAAALLIASTLPVHFGLEVLERFWPDMLAGRILWPAAVASGTTWLLVAGGWA